MYSARTPRDDLRLVHPPYHVGGRISEMEQQVVMSWKRLSGGKQGVEIGPDTDVVCPYHWAKPIHALNCDIVWPKELDEPPYGGGSKFVRTLFSSFSVTSISRL
jgi:hypothetical protein